MTGSEVTRAVTEAGMVGSIRKHEGETGKSVVDAAGSHGIEETSPDLLKNTPSNISKYAHEIQQCEGRQKYLAQTRSPSDSGDVRWYFCKVHLAENELAASVPRTEIVGKGDYFRFGMRDSLAIEASFLQREEELLSSWWKEYAECSEGPRGHPSSSAKSRPQSKVSSLEGAQSSQLFDLEKERVGVPVKGGLYEVDLVKRHCFPVYWNGENWRVLRGHWFARKGGLDWLPLREDVSEQLEFAYRSKVWRRRAFQPSGLFAARVDLQGSTLGLHALFTGEDDTWEAWLNVDASGFSSVITLGGNGIMLRRGYAASQSSKPTQDELRQQKEEEMDDYCSEVPVRHLVFMVHGIGQRLEKSNLVDDVGNFHHITASLAQQHLTSYQRGNQRVLFIPCQWRRGLKLSGESAVEQITLDGVRGLRVMLSATVHDVLYYMSPIYCQDIINSVSNQLNCLYLKFLKRNPGYDGKVSLYGHSLGSVLSYDILCHQENLSSPFPMEWMYKEHNKNEESFPSISTQSSEFHSTSNQDKNVSTNNETKITISSFEEVNANERPALQVPENENMEDSSVTLDLAEPSAMVMNLKQPPLEKDSVQQASDSRGMLSYQSDSLCEALSMNFGVPEADSMRISEGVSDGDKDKAIQLMTEEINSLKARITELESQCGSKGNEVIPPTTIMNQSVPEIPPPGQSDMQKSYTPYIKYTKLEFKVDTFFAVGSPLGVFLALRNIRIGTGKGQEYWEEENITEEIPGCRQMFNIFHPFDPVAYRVEPLVCKEYISRRPVIIPYHKGGKRLHIGFQEFTEDLALRSQAIKDQLKSVRVKVLTLCESSRNNDNFDETPEDTQAKEERSYGSIMMEKLTGSVDGRIDHVLQNKTFQHPYISAIGSHTNYWRDYDTALFILKHLYRDIPQEPELLEETKYKSKDENGSKGWSNQSEAMDEKLPLTFADAVLVRNFSRSARKIAKRS
ncbi:phospholipase SGR2 isoform X2 [Diospyros lotus]|uniref:phospholipase SGR2 isoform X2 n=1 Tax=Diospyros lotus TaxID=55363 RepID=UPI002259C8FF|nr:phospholipase SGR2 isoform X2 [Diospyros lotus]